MSSVRKKSPKSIPLHIGTIKKSLTETTKSLRLVSEQNRELKESNTQLRMELQTIRKQYENIESMLKRLSEDNASLRESIEKKFEYAIEKVPAIRKRINEIDDKLINELGHSLDKTLKVSREILWSEIFNNTIIGCEWLKDVPFSPGRWAVGYSYLYVLFRILREIEPKRILELGLGQSTRMIGSYCSLHSDVKHIVVEHDENWSKFFIKSGKMSGQTELMHLDTEMVSFSPAGHPVRAYADFTKIFHNQKFELILIDAPIGGDMKELARIDVLQILPNCLADSFVILIDDTERIGEQGTVKLMKEKLNAAGVLFDISSRWRYAGEKDMILICSPDNSFLCTM